MPYIVSFLKPVVITDHQHYINDCCIGADIVLGELLPSLRERYGSDLQSHQEDWGWLVWFEQSGIKLAVDVHANDSAAGEFQIHLTTCKPRLILGAKIKDTPELESLRELVLSHLIAWQVAGLKVERVNERYRSV